MAATRLWGAHNALTAYGPRHLVMWLGAMVWRCQRRRPLALLAAGARLFDWRVCRRGCRWCGAHGVVTLRVDPVAELDRLVAAAPVGERLTVRLILERGDEADRQNFKWLCLKLEAKYPPERVRFIGGNYKPTWERLHRFATDDVGDDIEQRIGSMDTRRPWGKLWPWLWARLYDRSDTADSAERRPLLRDFI